jgi:PrcB C-terminal/Putative zinc-finger
MACNERHETLMAQYVDGTLSGDALNEAKKHLETCAHCTADLQGLDQTLAMLRELPEISPPSGLAESIFAQTTAKASLAARIIDFLFPKRRAPLTALAGGLVVFTVLVVLVTIPNLNLKELPPAPGGFADAEKIAFSTSGKAAEQPAEKGEAPAFEYKKAKEKKEESAVPEPAPVDDTIVSETKSDKLKSVAPGPDLAAAKPVAAMRAETLKLNAKNKDTAGLFDSEDTGAISGAGGIATGGETGRLEGAGRSGGAEVVGKKGSLEDNFSARGAAAMGGAKKPVTDEVSDSPMELDAVKTTRGMPKKLSRAAANREVPMLMPPAPPAMEEREDMDRARYRNGDDLLVDGTPVGTGFATGSSRRRSFDTGPAMTSALEQDLLAEDESEFEESKPLSIIDRFEGAYGGVDRKATAIVLDKGTWAGLWKNLNRRLDSTPPLPSVDFSRQFIVGWFLGMKTTGGHAIRIRRVEFVDQKVVVYASVRHPEPGTIVTQALTQPYSLVVIPKPEGITINANTVVEFVYE